MPASVASLHRPPRHPHAWWWLFVPAHVNESTEPVDNLGGVPATGCLVSIGYPKFKGGLGGYARYVAICPPSTRK